MICWRPPRCAARRVGHCGLQHRARAVGSGPLPDRRGHDALARRDAGPVDASCWAHPAWPGRWRSRWLSWRHGSSARGRVAGGRPVPRSPSSSSCNPCGCSASGLCCCTPPGACPALRAGCRLPVAGCRLPDILAGVLAVQTAWLALRRPNRGRGAVLPDRRGGPDRRREPRPVFPAGAPSWTIPVTGR